MSRTVQLDGLVLLEIITQSNRRLPNYVTGQLLGLDVDDTLEVTHCFATPEKDEDGSDYQTRMMQRLAESNVDGNTVGWFFSSFQGSFYSEHFLEAQYSYQSNLPHSVVVVYDPYRTTAGRLFVKAYRLRDAFMTLFKDGKFSREDFSKAGLEFNEILEELPLKVHNSHLVHAFLYEVRENKEMSCTWDRLMANATPFAMKSLDILNASVDEYAAEQNKYHHHTRDANRLKADQEAFLNKKREEDEVRLNKGLKPLGPVDTSKNPLFKPLPPHSRLDAMLQTNQLAHYAKSITADATQGLEKLYVIQSLHK